MEPQEREVIDNDIINGTGDGKINPRGGGREKCYFLKLDLGEK